MFGRRCCAGGGRILLEFMHTADTDEGFSISTVALPVGRQHSRNAICRGKTQNLTCKLEQPQTQLYSNDFEL